MSIKVTLKPLKGFNFQVDANPEDNISDLKIKIAEAKPDYPAEFQKLIFSGKVLADESSIEASGYQPSGFIVIMVAKAKAAPAARPAAALAPQAAEPAAAHAAGFKDCLEVIETIHGDDPDRKIALTRAMMESYMKSIKSPSSKESGLRRTNSILPGLSHSSLSDQSPMTEDEGDDNLALEDVDMDEVPTAVCSPEEDLSGTIDEAEPFQPETDPTINSLWLLPQRYSIGRTLGSGVYGEVRIAWDAKQKRQVAIKRMNDFWRSSGDCKRILREVAILSRLHHHNIVQVFDLPLPPDIDDFTDLYIVMELCDTSLLEVCKNCRGVSLAQARKLIHDIVLGCSYLHSAGIYHRDLKPGNCVVNRNCTVKICDFNLSRVVDDPAENDHKPVVCSNATPVGQYSPGPAQAPLPIQRALTKFVCTPWYRAPEVILALGYSEAVDVWSVGCIASEIFSALNEEGREPHHRVLFPGSGTGRDGFDGRPSKNDQLNVIFDLLGTPSPAEQRKLERIDRSASQRLSRYERRDGAGLHARIPPQAGDKSISLVDQMLKFQPQKRIPMADALKHAFFEGVTCSPDEQFLASEHIDIGFDEDSIRLGQPIDTDFHAQVRQLLVVEIRKFHPNGLSPLGSTPAAEAHE